MSKMKSSPNNEAYFLHKSLENAKLKHPNDHMVLYTNIALNIKLIGRNLHSIQVWIEIESI